MARNKGSYRSFLYKVCDSSLAKTVCLVSAVVTLLGLGSIHHKQPAVTIQSSSGAQSPNVSGVQHDVQIRYASTAVGMPEGSPQHTSPVAPTFSARAGSTIQISHGAQSPNIDSVGGNVDIRYGPSTAASEQKLAEPK